MPGVRSAIESMRYDRDRINDSTIKRTEVEARVKIVGSGEANVAVTFPVVFVERPSFVCGHELEENHSPETTNYPAFSATVLRWEIKERPDDRAYYVGCDVGVVALGKEDMESYAHLVFKGDAFRGPSLQPPTTDDEI